MAKARKTVEVAKIKDKINAMILVKDKPIDSDIRYALCTVLELVLDETGNYKGFCYLDGAEKVTANDYDDSKRMYF